MLVVTNRFSDVLELTILIEKPVSSEGQDVYWTAFLNLSQGTNPVAQHLELASTVINPKLLERTAAKSMGFKVVQRFTVSLATNCLPHSSIAFAQNHRPLAQESPFFNNLPPATIVSLLDVCNAATGGFSSSSH